MHDHGYLRLAFAAPLKEAAAILLDRPIEQMRGDAGFDREAILPDWGFSTRDFLQRFGTEVMRENFGQDFWIKHMRNRLAQMTRGHDRFVITDCRFDNEAELVRSLGGIVVEVKRPGFTGGAHASDAGVKADDTVYNDSSLYNLSLEAARLANSTR